METSIELLWLFTLFFIITYSIKFALIILNITHIRRNYNKVPSEFVEKISLNDHQKAQDYTIAKHKLGIVQMMTSIALLIFWIYFEGLNTLNNFVFNAPTSELWQGMIFFGIYGFVGFLISIPFDIYHHFFLEHKFGFNKMTFKIYLTDQIKQTLLGILLGLPILYALLFFITEFSEQWWYLAWIFIIVFQFILLWAYPKFIAPLFNKFTPLDDSYLVQDIDKLCNRCDVKFKDYFVMNASLRSSHGNAYFTGFGKNKRIVFFDTLINTLEKSEIIAVLAHELGHFKKKHIQQSLVIALVTLFMAFAILGHLYQEPMFYQTFHIEKPSPHVALLLFNLIAPIFTFILTPIGTWFSRKNEFEADEFAATYAKSSDLISALLKMYKDNSSTLTPHPFFAKFYYSHPPAMERVEFLKKFK